jgi:hypothetical protein
MSKALLKMCGYYCSCLLVIGIGFYAILIALISTGNRYLLKHESEKADKIEAFVIAIIINAVCLGGCVACTLYLRIQDAKEREILRKEEEELDKDLKMN